MVAESERPAGSQTSALRQVERDDGGLAGHGSDEQGRMGAFPIRLRTESSRHGSTDEEMLEDIDEAAAARGCSTELGVLRLTMKRLLKELLEAENPVPVAETITRVANASIRAAQAHQALMRDGLTNALTEVLTQLDAEQETR